MLFQKFCLAFTLLTLAVLAPARAAEPAQIAPTVKSFMTKYCVDCHGPDHENSALRFNAIPYEVGDQAVAQRWQDILDALNLDQMPPDDAEQPSREELANALETLTANLAEARKRLTDSGGQVVLRRLNRREYQLTIKALFGVPVDIEKLPEDGTIDGFDTLGQANSFSSLHLERYLELGREVLDQVIVTSGRQPKPIERRSEPEGIAKKIGEEIPKLEQKIKNFDKQIAEGRKHLEIRREISKTEIALSREYLSRDEAKSGAVIPFRGLNPSTWVSLGNKPLTGRYQIRVRCGAVSEDAPKDLYLKVVRGEHRSKVPDAVDHYHVTGTLANRQEIEFTVDIDGIRSNRLTFERRHRLEKLPRFAETRNYYFKYPLVADLLDDRRPNLWIDWVDIKGPRPEPPAPLSAERLFKEKNSERSSETATRDLFERFVYEAFRHQKPDSDYIDRLMTIFSASRAEGAEYHDALKDALAVVLASPRFLFLYEPADGLKKRRPLSDRELAVRLSYFLWSAPPDDELYRVAKQGKLRDPDTLAAQVDRMIRSERSAVFVENFTNQWLEFSRLDLIDPASVARLSEPKDHDSESRTTVKNDYDVAVQQSSKREVTSFLGTLLQKDLAVTNLMDSDFVVVDSVLAQFYGWPGVSGDEFRKVDLPEGSERGGLLGQSAILTLTGTGDRTSPVERGAFVLRKLLNRPPPPAPANVPMLDEESIGERSIRETLSIHMTKAQCRSCHRRIDPLGFGMENFDPAGRWRTEVKSTDKTKTFPIEPAGVMPDGKRKFANFREMKRHLVTDRDALLSGLTEAIMTYAVGRTIGFSDQETVEQIVKETARSGYGLRTLIHNIVQSEPFLTK